MTSLTDIPVSLTPQVGNGKDYTTVTIEDNFSSSEGSVRSENQKQVVTSKGGIFEEKHKTFTPLISERAVDQPRPLKVIYIGGGISGILAAIKFREAVPDLDLTIYEKNP